MRSILRYALCFVAAAASSLYADAPQAKGETSNAQHTMSANTALSDEAAIKQLIDGFITAVRAKDINGVESAFSREIISYDFAPPLQERGAEVFFKRWRQLFDSFEGPIEFELRELSVTTGTEVAFSHCLNHMAGVTKTGQKVDRWLRWTACYRKVDGRWLIVHEHVSVPTDAKTGKAALDLKP